MFLIILGILIFLVWFYVLFLREWLVAIWPERFTNWHAIEDYLWQNSRTLLISRATWLLSAFTAFHEWLAASGFDVTPIYTQITELIPETYQKFVPLVISLGLMGLGFVFSWLRKQTTEPLEVKTETNVV
jgi:hypothetical protein